MSNVFNYFQNVIVTTFCFWDDNYKKKRKKKEEKKKSFHYLRKKRANSKRNCTVEKLVIFNEITLLKWKKLVLHFVWLK